MFVRSFYKQFILVFIFFFVSHYLSGFDHIIFKEKSKIFF